MKSVDVEGVFSTSLFEPQQPVRQWVLSFPFQLRFLFASNPGVMSQVLGIVYRIISGALLKKAGCTRKNGMTGAVTLVQRFGSALNLNVHFHMLFIDGAYSRNQYGMNITHVLLNNSQLGKISKEQRAGEWPVWQTDLHNPSFAAYAKLCGAHGARVTEPEKLEDALDEALKFKGPALVEIITDPDLI